MGQEIVCCLINSAFVCYEWIRPIGIDFQAGQFIGAFTDALKQKKDCYGV